MLQIAITNKFSIDKSTGRYDKVSVKDSHLKDSRHGNTSLSNVRNSVEWSHLRQCGRHFDFQMYFLELKLLNFN